MPFTHLIDAEHRLAAIRFAGTVTGAEIVEGIAALFDSPEWESGFQVIWDGRAIATLILDPDDAEQVVAASVGRRSQTGEARTAVLSLGFTVYTSALVLTLKANRNTNREIKIFESMDEALAWLGRTELPPSIDALLR